VGVPCSYARPEYIRLIAAGHYSDAYMINWNPTSSPAFSDAPATVRASPLPACAVEEQPVAICRLKRVAADYKDDIRDRLPQPRAKERQARRLHRRGPCVVDRRARPVAHWLRGRDYEADPFAGGMMRTQIPKFRLPETVIDEEVGYILGLEPELRTGQRVESLKAYSARVTTRYSSAAAHPLAATWMSPAARRPRPTSTSGSTGCRASRLATSTKSANA
jgi:NADPH-dependent glutamate synthase beta subunit-like oxidoreductase